VSKSYRGIRNLVVRDWGEETSPGVYEWRNYRVVRTDGEDIVYRDGKLIWRTADQDITPTWKRSLN
jgi:hypothetical protein